MVFLALQVATPIHQAVSASLGARLANWLNERLLDACVAPPGIGHLEDPELTSDTTVARDFDLGITGPPLHVAMDFIASGLCLLFSGIACAVALLWFAWWAPLLLATAWGATHWLLRESAVWRDRNTEVVRAAQRHADYAYRLAVEAPAAKELRLFGLPDWVIERFRSQRRTLYQLQHHATRLRERQLLLSVRLVVAANTLVFLALARALAAGTLELAAAVVFLQTALGTSAIAFGGWSWALDGAAAPVLAVLRLGAKTAQRGALAPPEHGAAVVASSLPARSIRFRGVTFGYGATGPPVLDGLDLEIPAGSSLAIVGRNGAGKTTLAKLLCRLYEPRAGVIEVDGIDLRRLDLVAWRARIAAVFQDYVRYELPLRDNVAPGGAAADPQILAALEQGGARDLAALDVVLARGYQGGIDLSGGQWQRVALARALCAVGTGAGVVLLDEPTAQLDVRGEREIFERILATTRHCTTILISHRFSTVRLADRICVVEGGRVVELGSHDELMALGGRYRTMFELQASRFVELDEQGQEVVLDTLV